MSYDVQFETDSLLRGQRDILLENVAGTLEILSRDVSDAIRWLDHPAASTSSWSHGSDYAFSQGWAMDPLLAQVSQRNTCAAASMTRHILDDKGDEVTALLRDVERQERQSASARLAEAAVGGRGWQAGGHAGGTGAGPVEALARLMRDLGPAALDPRELTRIRPISCCGRVPVMARQAHMYKLVAIRIHESGANEYVSIFDGITKYKFGLPCQERDRGFFVSSSARGAMATCFPHNSRASDLPMAVLKVLVSGRGYRQGPVLSFPHMVPISLVVGPV